MHTLKFIIYFNLTVGFVLLWIHIKAVGLYFDYFVTVGMILTLWYNWETLKRLKGHRNGLNKLIFIIGILTVLFGVTLLVGSILMINDGLKSKTPQIAMGMVYIPLSLSTIILSLKTLRLYVNT